MRFTTQLEVSCQHLEQALKLYFEGSAFYSALTLAGAAEELLARYVAEHNATSAFDSLQAGSIRLATILRGDGTSPTPKEIATVMNHARNVAKHQRPDSDLNYDPRVAARDMLDRCVTNYYTVMSFEEVPETDLVRRFLHEDMQAAIEDE